MYNVRSSDAAWQSYADNLSSLEQLRKAREVAQSLEIPADGAILKESTYAHNIYYVK